LVVSSIQPIAWAHNVSGELLLLVMGSSFRGGAKRRG
jgi:hypothetical protein